MKFFCALFCAITSFANYSSAEFIDLKTIKENTLQSNPNVIAAKLQLENAKQAYKTSISAFLPNVDFAIQAQQSQLQNYDVVEKHSYGLTSALSIFSGFYSYNDLKEKFAEIKVAQSKFDRTVSNAAFEAKVNYINLKWAYQTVELLEKIRDRRIENNNMVKLKYNSGNADLGSLKRVEADVAMAEYDLQKAKRYVKTACAALLKTLGRSDVDTIIETKERMFFSDNKTNNLELSIIERTPEFISAVCEVESYQSQKAKTKSAYVPSVKLSGSWGKDSNSFFQGEENWNISLTSTYSIFNGTARYAEFQIASNLLKISLENLKNTVNSLKSCAIENYNSLQDAYEIVAVISQYLKASELQSEISERKYVNGLSTYYDWYSIENDYISAQKNFLDAQKNAEVEKCRWENFIGEAF
ncbi:MAG: TolC family protein [Elusimicrobiota bacterium]|jgi:outer membrane protein TolC|nr:TolC family protein [Elusimicrobiota bacterium]